MPTWKILVVDDEPRGVELMERVLRPLGDVHKASSIREARALIDSIAFDAVVTDQRMPSASGVELLSEIAEKSDSIGRVLITGYTDIDATIAAINQGRIHAYLSKPCPPSQLRLTVESVLERVRLNRENLRLLAELSERNRKLVHATRLLRESQRAAERANRAKSAFLENVSQELRTPLTTIVGYTQLLKDPEIGTAERANGLGGILASSDHLLCVINDILEVARAEAGELQVELTSFSLRELFAEIERLIQPRAHEAKLEVRFDVDARLSEIHSDPFRLRQILLNVIEHALRFTRTGAVCVAARPSNPASATEILIADAAWTLDPSAIATGTPALSEPRRLESGELGQDLGLGLTMSERISALLGAELEVECIGPARIRVLLPGPDTSEQLSSAVNVARREGAALPSMLSLFDAQLLIVGANIVDQRILRSVLRRTGAQVDVAPDAEGAIALIQATADARQSYTAAVMDAQLRFQGRSAAVALREQGFCGALVALDTAADEEGNAEGFDATLRRPIDRLQLVELVGRLADRAALKGLAPR